MKIYKTKIDYRVRAERVFSTEVTHWYFLEEKRQLLGMSYWWLLDASDDMGELIEQFREKKYGKQGNNRSKEKSK